MDDRNRSEHITYSVTGIRFTMPGATDDERMEQARAFVQSYEIGARVALVHDADNPAEKNAVGVYRMDGDYGRIGYVSSRELGDLWQHLDEHGEATATVVNRDENRTLFIMLDEEYREVRREKKPVEPLPECPLDERLLLSQPDDGRLRAMVIALKRTENMDLIDEILNLTENWSVSNEAYELWRFVQTCQYPYPDQQDRIKERIATLQYADSRVLSLGLFHDRLLKSYDEKNDGIQTDDAALMKWLRDLSRWKRHAIHAFETMPVSMKVLAQEIFYSHMSLREMYLLFSVVIHLEVRGKLSFYPLDEKLNEIRLTEEQNTFLTHDQDEIYEIVRRYVTEHDLDPAQRGVRDSWFAIYESLERFMPENVRKQYTSFVRNVVCYCYPATDVDKFANVLKRGNCNRLVFDDMQALLPEKEA